MAKPIVSRAVRAEVSAIEIEYPNQFKRMVGYAQSKGIGEDAAHDLANDAWLQALETFDESKGLDPIQWTWWLLQHNVLPAYGRRKKKEDSNLTAGDEFASDPPAFGEGASAEDEDALVTFLKNHLPTDLWALCETLIGIRETTDSKHIYHEAAQRLNMTISECRNCVKRLRRACRNLKSKWEQQ